MDASNERERDLGGRALGRFALVAGLGVVLPGLLKYFLTEFGYPTLGTVVWVSGYATAVLLVWLLWIRPLDLTGPSS